MKPIAEATSEALTNDGIVNGVRVNVANASEKLVALITAESGRILKVTNHDGCKCTYLGCIESPCSSNWASCRARTED